MSDTSQGPGWWIASDGKWYPPAEPTASAPPPPQPTQPPPPTAPTVTPQAAPPPKKSGGGGKGCIIALAVVGGLVFLGIIASIAAITFFGGKAADKLQEAATEKPCTIITSDDASSALGSKYDVVKLEGLNSLVGVALDDRAVTDGDACWIRPADTNTSGVQGRVAKTSGGDARFQKELTAAKGTSTDQGNGLSVETLGYFLKDVDGLGDEAFCTDTGLTGASGVVFRKGDNVYYVSTGIDPNASGPSAEANCDLTVKLAKKAN